ncbi:ribonuclease Z [Candidatus Sulfidibacterium hydrothermale]|uniref:ribonuclease Z n=1 Tax=Candidatus Sulfidibacterium hydrothermale TaxID=2875962 RepID=UPI001F0B0099|nr:ribonuclease Z [Candidatus Sulfidibacterium hydrothermale]UBM63238.1 ribonuclease Z [Candidatus Sulfidibacterium hydrothermale]
MSDFEITILGNGSAVPTSWQNPTAQMVRYGRQRFLVDCGEGTQMQMIRYNISYRNLSHVFISHLHGDHYFGLVGLISTLHLYGRQVPLHVYGPEPLEEIIRMQLDISGTHLHFPLVFHVLSHAALLYEDRLLEVHSFPLKHSLPTWGFLFKEKQKERNLNKDFVSRFHPGVEQMHRIKQGADYELPDGKVLPNREITHDPFPSRSYAYCSDTAYDEDIIPFIQGADLLYHEATFDDSMAGQAAEKRHSTARQAATIAAKAKVKKLLLGHFSARFRDPEHLLHEARQVFPDTFLSRQGEKYIPGV